MKNVLLIGGEGYIGNIVAQNLMSNGSIVTSYDNLMYNNHQCVLNKIQLDNCNFIYGDMQNKERLESVIENSDAVVLLAGLVGDPITKKYPEESALINDQGVKNVIDLCAKYNVENFIFISTCSNYGLIENNELADENYKLNPELISLLNPDQVCDMPELIELGLERKLHMNAFPLHEYWIDVGQPQTLEKVNGGW